MQPSVKQPALGQCQLLNQLGPRQTELLAGPIHFAQSGGWLLQSPGKYKDATNTSTAAFPSFYSREQWGW